MILQLSLAEAALAGFASVLVISAINDVTAFRIPNAFSIAALLLYPLYVFGASQPVAWHLALVVAVLAFAVGLFIFGLGWLGGGDVKLLTVMALWAGPDLILDALFVTGLTGGLMGLFWISRLGQGFAIYADRIGWHRVCAALLSDCLPYGVAIAAGGLYVLPGLLKAA